MAADIEKGDSILPAPVHDPVKLFHLVLADIGADFPQHYELVSPDHASEYFDHNALKGRQILHPCPGRDIHPYLIEIRLQLSLQLSLLYVIRAVGTQLINVRDDALARHQRTDIVHDGDGIGAPLYFVPGIDDLPHVIHSSVIELRIVEDHVQKRRQAVHIERHQTHDLPAPDLEIVIPQEYIISVAIGHPRKPQHFTVHLCRHSPCRARASLPEGRSLHLSRSP